MGNKNHPPNPTQPKRVAVLVAVPEAVWDRIRLKARVRGVGPSRVLEPVLLDAFGQDQDVST